MIRFIKELLKPSLKCQRAGHKQHKTIYRRTYRRHVEDSFLRYAIYLCKEEKIVCPRCKTTFQDWCVKSSKGYDSYSIPSNVAEELRENGVVEL